MPHPTFAAQQVLLSGPAFGADERIRRMQVEHFQYWRDLVDRRLIATVRNPRPKRAGIDAMERTLGVGKYRGR